MCRGWRYSQFNLKRARWGVRELENRRPDLLLRASMGIPNWRDEVALKNRVATTQTRLPRICSLTQLLLVDNMDERKIAKRRIYGMQPIDSFLVDCYTLTGSLLSLSLLLVSLVSPATISSWRHTFTIPHLIKCTHSPRHYVWPFV